MTPFASVLNGEYTIAEMMSSSLPISSASMADIYSAKNQRNVAEIINAREISHYSQAISFMIIKLVLNAD